MPIITSHGWELLFEFMGNASDYAVGAVSGQQRDAFFHDIYHTCKVLNESQVNYSTNEKELLVVVITLVIFCSYLFGLKFIVFTDHATLKYLFTKGNYKPHLFRCILLLQAFGFEIKYKKGVENAVTNHLSRSENSDITKKEKNIVEEFPL